MWHFQIFKIILVFQRKYKIIWEGFMVLNSNDLNNVL